MKVQIKIIAKRKSKQKRLQNVDLKIILRARECAEMENYVSLIIDIEKSKAFEVNIRNEIQKYISDCIIILNDLFKEEMECFVTFSAGDELQGLFHDVVAAVLYFRLFEVLMNPVKVRAGIGIGEWSVKIENGLSTQQDGPVYHRARKAIEEVHKSQLQNIRIFSVKDDIWTNHLINASVILKRQQISTQNLVQVIIELLYPFVANDMSWGDLNRIKELLEIKYKIGPKSFSVAGKTRTNLENRKLDIDEITVIDTILIDGKIKDVEDILLKRNMTTIVSKILGCTRQNVDSIVKRGNVNKIRELDYMALQYIEQRYGGEDDINYFGTHFR